MKNLWARLACLHHTLHVYLSSLFHILLFQVNPFWLQLSYFITLSSLGFIALKASKPTSLITPLIPRDIDLFFTSISAVTVSSMSTVEMEVFSNPQLLFLTLLMFMGGEVFTSVLGLHLFHHKIGLKQTNPKFSDRSKDTKDITYLQEDQESIEIEGEGSVRMKLKLKSIKTLIFLVLFYLLALQAMGSTLIYIYLNLIPNAKKTLGTKHINLLTFSIFTTISTFANCGFVPTNENMIVFKQNPGLLLILMPQLLLGNTLFPVFLRFLIKIMEKITKKSRFRYMLNNCEELGYDHLFSRVRSMYLGFTVLGFLVLQLVVFFSLEWYSNSVHGGLSVYEKVVGSVFVVANTRYGGESVFDLSVISPAILVMFVFFMYIPPYTSYLPIHEVENKSIKEGGNINTRKNKGFLEHIIFSQLTYLLIFTILICITERHKMKHDPLNFNVLNIVFEVVSAYGNVGFSVGYSCEKQINPDGHCKNAWTGFAGRWSDAGKFVLIIVMFFGRLKKFSQGGGRPWILA